MGKLSEFKKLANLAKQRLKEGNYQDKKKLKINYANSYYFKNISSFKKMNAELNFVIIDSNDDDKFNEKVFEMLKEDIDLLSPIGALCDYKIYDTLNEFEKQNYILRLSEKYRSAKELYLKNSKEKIS